jgi:hypothetical protein
LLAKKASRRVLEGGSSLASVILRREPAAEIARLIWADEQDT